MTSRILVVDDEQIVRHLLGAYLRPQGYEVIEAKNGKEAIRIAAETPPDLVITDLVMPEQEGIETIRQLREQRPDLKILAMSGAFGGEFLDMVKYLGACQTMRKPLRYTEVIAAVQNALGPSSAEGLGRAAGDVDGSY